MVCAEQHCGPLPSLRSVTRRQQFCPKSTSGQWVGRNHGQRDCGIRGFRATLRLTVEALYQVRTAYLCAAFVVREDLFGHGEVVACAPILRKRLDYWRTLAVRVEPCYGEELPPAGHGASDSASNLRTIRTFTKPI